MKQNKGFTLIELMIVLAIFSILVLVGYGSWKAGTDARERNKKTTAEPFPAEQEPSAVEEAVKEAKKNWGNTL